MASPGEDLGPNVHPDQSEPTEPTPEPAFQEAQKWIEAVTGRSFGDKDFRAGLENGILLCELLSAIKPGLVKKINRLPTPIAGLDNLTMFLRGCEELGLKGSQLFDPGDLQDTSIRANLTGSDCSRKLKNVLITIYWLGKAANSCTSYNGPTLNLREFEGLLSQLRRDCVCEDTESPKRSIRDSGYIDSWESERSDSLSPPRRCRDDSFDSLDSVGSRSRQTPSPDTVVRGNGDGDGGQRRLPDVRKDDMLARRTSCNEHRSAVPFNQYLPNKSNQSAYMPGSLRKKRTDREEDRRTWSNATSPVAGERTLRSVSLIDMRGEEDAILQPHSQSRYEHLHNQYNVFKEHEDQWQDDLARWKNRRRSASQDLIKKEEERKTMERLMMSEGDSAHRKKGIKTYKEIVEEKERREHELHEAYSKARTPEEKAAILQRYALRFTISDAILERLQIPKSPASNSKPGSSPSHHEQRPSSSVKQPNNVKAAVPETPKTIQITKDRQSSLETQQPSQPSPQKQIVSQSYVQPKSPPVSPTRAPPSKPVPLLTPKPYSQAKHSQSGLRTIKSDGLIRLNGESNADDKLEKVTTPVFSPTPREEPEGSGVPLQMHTPPLQPTFPSGAQTTPPGFEQNGRVKEEDSPPTSGPQESREETSTTLSQSLPTDSPQSGVKTGQKRNCVVKTTIVTELTQTHPLSPSDMPAIENIETPILNLAKRVSHWTWDPNEERKRQEKWQQEQERLLQEKYQREQEKLREQWERAQREVEEEERRHNEEEKRILEETVAPLTPRTSALSSPGQGEGQTLSSPPQDTIVLSLADWERKQELLEKQVEMSQSNGLGHTRSPVQQNGQKDGPQEHNQSATPQLQFIQDPSWGSKSESRHQQSDWKKTASLDRNQSPAQSHTTGMRRSGSYENVLGTHPSKSSQSSTDTPPPSPSRSVSGKKLCSSCSHPLGKGAAMIIESLGLYFHIQCFKCGICKGLLGDTSTGADVRIRNGLLNCHECYIKSRASGQPTTL
ncbi:LIM and calponin homology domains-containing protein 1a [Chanos chanos]|uniref:LIM and calponin homology domains-containing protein 1a n=1 Tax=Chanos chanos TaxID=29144 RepID=A0A6J2WGY0_CHACN|nr:LIM and calponin homology domains-containing protein 1-like [Chanos chanos]